MLYDEQKPELRPEEPTMGEIPDWNSMLEAWNNGTFDMARMDPKDYVPFPKEKENWNQEPQKPVKEPTLYDKVTVPVMKGFRKLLPGYYEGKVPEELK